MKMKNWTCGASVAVLLFGMGCTGNTSQSNVVTLNPSPFGVHVGGAVKENWPIPWLMSQAKEVGAGWVRINFRWDALEPKEGSRDWSLTDLAVKEAAKNNLNLLIQIRGYALSSLYGSHSDQKVAAFANIVGEMVNRYKDKVHHWQIENEVTAAHNGYTSLDHYLQVLKASYRAIKEADPNAKVLLAGFGSALSEPIVWQDDKKKANASMADIKYLLEKAKNDFDILDLHLYHNPEHIVKKVELYRDLMKSFGYQKPIWATEMGGPDLRYYEKKLGSAPPPEAQFAEMVQRYTTALANGIERVFWHKLWGKGEGQEEKALGETGILARESRAERFALYQVMVQKLRGATSVEKLKTAEDVYAYKFNKPSGDIYVIWSKHNKEVDLPVNATALRITDPTGKASQQSTPRVYVGRKPVFVEPGS